MTDWRANHVLARAGKNRVLAVSGSSFKRGQACWGYGDQLCWLFGLRLHSKIYTDAFGRPGCFSIAV
jgi:hypothetical protein